MSIDLRNLDVLIDSNDLALSDGTGVKSFGLNLVSILKELGANPELLVSARGNRNPTVARAMLYDPAARQEKAVRGWPKALRHLLFKSRVAHHIPPNSEMGLPIPDSVFPFGLGCSTLFNCYRAARATQARFKRVSTFRTRKNYRIWHSTLPLPLRHKSAVHVATIHDLIPLLQPHLCDEIRPLFYQRVEDAIRHSRAIAVVSEHTKKDLLRYFSVPEEKIVLVQQFSHMSRETSSEARLQSVMKGFNLKKGRYILCVSTIEARKNIRRLIDAYLRLGSNLTLVIAGKMGFGGEAELEILNSLERAPGQDVRILNFVPSGLLPTLYQGALCMAFPSLYEGFGLPVLEAMISGCPVVCSSTSSLPEVAGNAACYVDPLNEESIHEGLARILNDAAFRQTLIENGKSRAAYFSRERFAGQIKDLYEKALE